MGFRFRKSIKIAPGLKLNIGKKGIGLSAGTKGAHISVNSNGRVTKTVGLPGTRLSYSTSKKLFSNKKTAKKATSNNIKNKAVSNMPQPSGKSNKFHILTIIFIIVVAIAAFFIHSHKISSINVKIDNLEMDVNSSQAVNLKITPENADTSDFEISVSDPSLANISGDLEKGFTVNTLSKEGKFSVTAEGNDIKSNSVEINVVDYKKAEKEAAEKAALAEAQKKAEEEKAAAEEAAQQNAEEANAAQSQPQQTNESNEKKVWISATGKKYHSRSSCSNMSSPQEVTVSEAEKRGYTPCKKCN